MSTMRRTLLTWTALLPLAAVLAPASSAATGSLTAKGKWEHEPLPEGPKRPSYIFWEGEFDFDLQFQSSTVYSHTVNRFWSRVLEQWDFPNMPFGLEWKKVTREVYTVPARPDLLGKTYQGIGRFRLNLKSDGSMWPFSFPPASILCYRKVTLTYYKHDGTPYRPPCCGFRIEPVIVTLQPRLNWELRPFYPNDGYQGPDAREPYKQLDMKWNLVP